MYDTFADNDIVPDLDFGFDEALSAASPVAGCNYKVKATGYVVGNVVPPILCSSALPKFARFDHRETLTTWLTQSWNYRVGAS